MMDMNTAANKGEKAQTTYIFNKAIAPPNKDTIILIEKGSLNFYVITKYICALLNNKGGTMIIGCDKNLLVKGVKMARESIDYFQRSLDECLKNFSPSVKGHEYSIYFVPLTYEDSKKVATRDNYIIEITVTVSNSEIVYFTNSDECWIKKSINAVEQVPVTNISSYYEKFLNKESEQKRGKLMERINILEGEGLQTLSSTALDDLKATVIKTLSKIKSRKEDLIKSNEKMI